MKKNIAGFHYKKIQSKQIHYNCSICEGNESMELRCKYFSQIKKVSSKYLDTGGKPKITIYKEKYYTSPIIIKCKLKQYIYIFAFHV